MSESTGKPGNEYKITNEPFMVIDRITQQLITQQLKAALEQLDTIVHAIREDDEATSLSLVYVNTVNARALLDQALKQLPWSPIPVEGTRRAVTAPLPPDRDTRGRPTS